MNKTIKLDCKEYLEKYCMRNKEFNMTSPHGRVNAIKEWRDQYESGDYIDVTRLHNELCDWILGYFDDDIKHFHEEGYCPADIAIKIGRSAEHIRKRLARMGITPNDGRRKECKRLKAS